MQDNVNFPNDDVTCIGPWYELRIDADGGMRGCHAISQDYAEKSSLSMLDWFHHGNEITKVRNNIAQGKPYEGCGSCYANDRSNIFSFRQRRNIQAAIYQGKHFKDSLEQSPAYDRMIGEVKTFYPAFMHVTLSNLCNLSCRMCFPNYSTQLSSAYKKIGLIDSDSPTLLDWTTDDNKWNEFLELVKNNNNLMSLHFMGGEPMYHKKFIEFIDWCNINNKTDFHFTFVSNGTVYNEDLLSKLNNFKSVHIEISIENLHPTNNYIRLNSDYNSVKNNILSLANNITNGKVVLRPVPQALSIMHYDSLIDFALENELSLDHNIIYKPDYLKCFVLPKHIKEKITEKIKTKYADILAVDMNNPYPSSLRTVDKNVIKKHIESILIQLNEDEPDNIEELRRKFIEYNIKMDSVSDYKFLDLYPELIDLYEEYSTI